MHLATVYEKLKTLILGDALNPTDHGAVHKLSLIAFFAWVGLGADGLSSSCYGPAEAFEALGKYHHLAIFVAIASAITVLVISSSYSQIIEEFPAGGGGYVVAGKLLSPMAGVISGCALLMDYVLTITISIASGADALFSMLPPQYQHFKLAVAMCALVGLSILNLRGIRESVVPLVPIFLTFLVTHAVVIVSTVYAKLWTLSSVVENTISDVRDAHADPAVGGTMGILILLLRAYSMGAGTYTGIEAVSNGLPILREPRVVTGKRTMRYMAISLAITVVGLMLAYLLYHVEVPRDHSKTLNAVLFEAFTEGWPSPWNWTFVLVTLISEAALLFVAAQAGFLGGPRVLSYMALDRWFPHRFAMLSDRLVTQNGVLLMGAAAFITLLFTRGSVAFLVVLYSINVFVTFVLSQLGMVKHVWQERATVRKWKKKLWINSTALVLCTFILITVVTLKFKEGGWVTLLATGFLVLLVYGIRRHYDNTGLLLSRLNKLVTHAESTMAKKQALRVASAPSGQTEPEAEPTPDLNARTAVMLVNGFNGLGLHTVLSVVSLFGNLYKNYVFVSVGLVDAGNFKGAAEIENLQKHTQTVVGRYVDFMRDQGYYAEGLCAIGTDVVDEVMKVAQALARFPGAVFFGGQLVFPQETQLTRFLHNNTAFAMQRRLYQLGIPMVVLPIRV